MVVQLQEQGSASQDAFGELDLALVEALQTGPRLTWSEIGTALDVSASTASRHWQRLVADGLAWLTAYAATDATQVAYVELCVRPDALAGAVEQLTALSWVLSVEHVAGGCDLRLIVSALDLAAVAYAVADLGAVPGVTGVRPRPATRVFSEGSGWRVGGLDARQRAALDVARSNRAAGADPLALADLPLLTGIGEDGRASYVSLAERLGSSEHAVRRRLARLTAAGRLIFRCDLAYGLAGWSVAVTLRGEVPADRLDAVGRDVGARREVRLCAAVAGEENLLVSALLRRVEDVPRLETALERSCPPLRIRGRDVTLRAYKRMGRLLDEPGRAVGSVPLGTHPGSASGASQP